MWRPEEWHRLLGDPPIRPAPPHGGFAPRASATRVPCLWDWPAWPTDEHGVCHFEVCPPEPSGRHGDYVHLKRIALLDPHLQWSRNPMSGQSWIGLLPQRLLILEGTDGGRVLFPPEGTHITVASWESLPDDHDVRQRVDALERVLDQSRLRLSPHLCTTCCLPPTVVARPERGTPDFVHIHPESELATVLNALRTRLGLGVGESTRWHMRFGLRAREQERSTFAWRRDINVNEMDD